jgi:hypothetical protein
MIKHAACLAFALGAAAPAFACTDAQMQIIANRFFALGDASLKSAPIAEALRQDLATCASEPGARKIGALAFEAMARRDAANGPVAMGYAEEAMREVFILQAIMGNNPRVRHVANQTGATTPVTFDDSYEVSKRVVQTLLALELRAGRTIDLGAILKPGDPLLKCDIHASSTAQQAAYWMKDRKGLTTGGMALVDRMLAACQPADYNGLSIRGYRADLLLSVIDQRPAAPDAVSRLREAQADSDAIFAQMPTGLHIGWKPSDLDRLDRATWKVVSASNVTLPMEQWFTPDNIGKTTTTAIIAAQLDLAYAQDLAPGGLTTFPLYRGVLTPAYALARALPEAQAREARKMLHRAASRHADGAWRREANKALKAPAAYLYNWIDPDYKAPAPAPAPTTP